MLPSATSVVTTAPLHAHRSESHSARIDEPAGPPRFVEVLREGTRPVVRAVTPDAAQVAGAHASPTGRASPRASPTAGTVRDALVAAVRGEAQLDSLIAAAQQGRTFSPSELLAMQATVFRYSHMVDVVSRATDRLVGGVKQTLTTQV